MHATQPLPDAAALHDARGLRRVEHASTDAERPSVLAAPLLPSGDLLRIVGCVEQAALTETKVTPDIALHLFPVAKRQRGERQLAHVAVLLAAPAPVAAGLLAADVTLFEKGDREPALGQEIGRGNADDAAADHHG